MNRDLKGRFIKGHSLIGKGLKGYWENGGGKPWNKKPDVFIICLQCGNEKQVKPIYQNTQKFCSKVCVDKYKDQGKRTIHKKIRQSLEYEEWRTKVFERDLYTCQDCGEIGGFLNAHHIKSFSEYPEFRFELSNGKTLCEPCHKLTENYGNRKMADTSKWAIVAKA